MKPARVGVVGAGFGAKVHVPAFRRDPRFEVVGIAALRSERARAAAREAVIPRAYSSWQELVDDPLIDVVSVAVPPAAQPEILERAVKARKHVFAEKPVGGGGPFSAELARLADENGRAHAVDFEFPEIDVFQLSRRWLDEGRIGRVRHASVSWHIESHAHRHRLNDGWKTSKTAGAGVLGLFLSHSFYYLEWLLRRRVEQVRASMASDSELGLDAADDVVHASLSLEGGLPVVVGASSCSPAGNGHRIEIHGDRGALVLENANADYISGFELTRLEGSHQLGEQVRSQWQPRVGVDGRVAAVASLLERLADWVETGTRMEPNLQDGARIEALLERARSQRWIASDGTA